MDHTTDEAEAKVLDRRAGLKALFGLAIAAAGVGALAVPGAAEAKPLTPAAPDAATDPAMARDEDLPKAEPTYYVYRRRYYYRRRRVIVYRRRPVYYRRRYRRVYFY